MVLSRLKRDDGTPVGDRQHACLFAHQAFFDHQSLAGLAERLLAGDHLHRLDRLRPVAAHNHPLARRQAVRLHDHRSVLAIVKVGQSMFGIVERLILGGGDRCTPQQVLAENLARLQLGRRLGGPKDPQPGLLERIDTPLRKRGFRSNHRQFDPVLLGKRDQLWEIGGRDPHVFGVQGRPCVSRCHDHASRPRALLDLPRQRMFSSAAANHQHVHRAVPHCSLPCAHERAQFG